MRCPNCGYKNENNRQYCSKCKTRLIYDEEDDFNDRITLQKCIDDMEEKNGVMRLAKTGALLGICLGLLMFFSNMSQYKLQLHQVVFGTIAYMFGGGVWGFSYAFGLHYLQRSFSFVFGISSIWAIWEFFKERNTLFGILKVIFIVFFSAIFAATIIWIPGFFRGIYKIFMVRNL